MNKEKQNQLFKRAWDKWGIDAQIRMVVEETSELNKELMKFYRNGNNRENIIEEIVDVMIMLDQMVLFFNVEEEEIQAQINYKLQRLETKLNQLDEEEG